MYICYIFLSTRPEGRGAQGMSRGDASYRFPSCRCARTDLQWVEARLATSRSTWDIEVSLGSFEFPFLGFTCVSWRFILSLQEAFVRSQLGILKLVLGHLSDLFVDLLGFTCVSLRFITFQQYLGPSEGIFNKRSRHGILLDSGDYLMSCRYALSNLCLEFCE